MQKYSGTRYLIKLLADLVSAKVVIDDKEILLLPKESTYVPMSIRHKVENPGVIPLVMIEVQNGEYLGDDDIIRFPDDLYDLSVK